MKEPRSFNKSRSRLQIMILPKTEGKGYFLVEGFFGKIWDSGKSGWSGSMRKNSNVACCEAPSN